MTRPRSLLLAGFAIALAGCTPAALAGLLGFASAAAPVAASAIDLASAQMQRAQQLAPGLSPARPDDAAILAELVARLDTLDACQANATAAISPDAGPTDAAKTTAALIDAAAALRGLVDAIAKAQPAPLPSTVLPSIDAGAPAKGSS
jgi:hypothetical protein